MKMFLILFIAIITRWTGCHDIISPPEDKNHIIFSSAPMNEPTLESILGIDITDYKLINNKVTFTNAGYAIPTGAFSENVNITDIKLLATSIGEQTFIGCSSLSSVSMPSAVTIGSQAFFYCSALNKVDISSCATLGSNMGDNGVFFGAAYGIPITVTCPLALNTDGDILYLNGLGRLTIINP